MASTDGGKSLDPDDPLDSPTTATAAPPAAPANDSVQPSMTIHPVSYSGVPMHMYPFPPGVIQSQPLRSKRRQVKNACTNCQKACKKCDDARPCLRCVKYGIAEECVDSQRKERKKGIKRGPYKKRDGKGSNGDQQQVDEPVQQHPHQQQGMPITNGVPPAPTPTGSPPMGYPVQVGYPNYYQFAAPPMAPAKPGEGQAAFYPPFLVPAVPAPQQSQGHPGVEGDSQAYPPMPPPPFYQAFVPFPQAYPPYMVPARADGQMAMTSAYAYAPPHMYPPKPMGSGPSADMAPHPGQTGRGQHRHAEEGVAGKD